MSVQRKNDAQGASKVSAFPKLVPKKQVACGQYDCHEGGVYLEDECICNHPIYISKLIQPIDDSGTAHVELSYYTDDEWHSIIRPRRAIYDRRQILGLSEIGLDVTSENAGALINYFRELENRSGSKDDATGNVLNIEKVYGFARFGWFNNKFMPLCDDNSFKAYFTGAVEYENVFNAFGRKGDFNKWLEVVKPFYAPDAHPAVRTALAAATASVLLGYIDSGLPFFVHLFGASGNGKTLTLKLVASMFGNPSADGGGLIQSFSSTQVGLERRAEVLNNVPMLLDELGVKGGSTEREVSELVYQLTEGVGKTRGAREGGIQKMMKWHNVIISTGEQALTSLTSQAGVINRVISVDVNKEEIFGNVQQANEVSEIINNNYGWAAKIITEYIANVGSEIVKEWQTAALKELKALKDDGMNKQLISASFLATADDINRAEFGIDGGEDRKWLTDVIATQSQVSSLRRALKWIEGWRGYNGKCFFEKSSDVVSDVMGNQMNVWGVHRKDGWAYIPAKLSEEMERVGLKYSGFIAEAKAAGELILDCKGNTTIPCKVGKWVIRCVVIREQPPEDAEEPKDSNDEAPLKIANWGSNVT